MPRLLHRHSSIKVQEQHEASSSKSAKPQETQQMQRHPSMEDQFRNSPNSPCRLPGASTTPNCLKPTKSCQTPSSAFKENLAANKPHRGSFLTHCSKAPLYPKGSDKPVDKFRLPPRPSPGGTRGCARSGGQHRDSTGAPRGAPAPGAALSPAAPPLPGLRSPGPAAPAQEGPRAARGSAGTRQRRPPGHRVPAAAEEGRAGGGGRGKAGEEAITRVLLPFLLRGPRKTPLMLRKCPLLRCAELMTM